VGETWYVGYDLDICGMIEPPLPPDQLITGPSYPDDGQPAFTTPGSGIITVGPNDPSQTGANAVLGAFVREYRGMVLTQDRLRLPLPSGVITLKSGQTCPPGTPQAGLRGHVEVAYWQTLFDSPHLTMVRGNPAELRFTSNQLISIGFLADGSSPARPGSLVTSALLEDGFGFGPSEPNALQTSPTFEATCGEGGDWDQVGAVLEHRYSANPFWTSECGYYKGGKTWVWVAAGDPAHGNAGGVAAYTCPQNDQSCLSSTAPHPLSGWRYYPAPSTGTIALASTNAQAFGQGIPGLLLMESGSQIGNLVFDPATLRYFGTTSSSGSTPVSSPAPISLTSS
jgi:hypothetical protein